MDKRARDSFHTLWMIAIFLCVIASLFALIFTSCTKGTGESAAKKRKEAEDAPAIAQTASAEPTITPEPTPSPTPEPGPTILEQTADMGEEYLSKFVFIGDSTTYGLGTYGVLPWPQVWVPSSGTLTLSDQSYTQIDYYTEGSSDPQSLTIEEAARLRQPEYLIITLGLNGISFMEEDEFKYEYNDLIHTIQSVSPDTKIICQSILPVIDSLVSSDIGNDRINRANQWVLQIAEENGLRYLNTHDALLDETGNLSNQYNNGVDDGIHLNEEGLHVITNSVRTHGYR